MACMFPCPAASPLPQGALPTPQRQGPLDTNDKDPFPGPPGFHEPSGPISPLNTADPRTSDEGTTLEGTQLSLADVFLDDTRLSRQSEDLEDLSPSLREALDSRGSFLQGPLSSSSGPGPSDGFFRVGRRRLPRRLRHRRYSSIKRSPRFVDHDEPVFLTSKENWILVVKRDGTVTTADRNQPNPKEGRSIIQKSEFSFLLELVIMSVDSSCGKSLCLPQIIRFIELMYHFI